MHSSAGWFGSLRTPSVRRGIALASVVLATGGLVLHRAPTAAGGGSLFVRPAPAPLVAGKNSLAFSSFGLHGMLSLSHTSILEGSETTVYGELRLVGDAAERGTRVARAPIAMAVVLDTSGSMSGEKIEDAKRSVLRLIADMRDDDEIAVVRYSDTSELVQELARVGSVRSSLSAKIRELEASGGTNIPAGLSHGLRAFDSHPIAGSAAVPTRVRRIVLVSDGLDATRAQAENLARSAFGSGITVSSLGIGLDFDESYMGSVASSGHGNFAFVNDGSSLATFLHRELEEASQTTVENAKVRMKLPPNVRFVSATGADAVVTGEGVELSMGSLFAGDQRRVIVELAARATSRDSDRHIADYPIESSASWDLVGWSVSGVNTSIGPLHLVALADQSAVERGRDDAVFASVVSVLASKREIEAANAYARGDAQRAAFLATENERKLTEAAAAAPPAAAPAIRSQLEAYRQMKEGFTTVEPSSAAGRTAVKAGTAKDMWNLNRSAF